MWTILEVEVSNTMLMIKTVSDQSIKNKGMVN